MADQQKFEALIEAGILALGWMVGIGVLDMEPARRGPALALARGLRRAGVRSENLDKILTRLEPRAEDGTLVC